LTQFNLQIRSEFRPLYLEDIHSGGNDVWMEDTELVPYLNAFFPGWDVLGVDESGFTTSVVLEMYDDWTNNGVQLLSFIRLMSEAPNVDIELCDESWEVGEQIMHTLAYKKEWAKALAEAVEDVWLATREEDDSIENYHSLGNEYRVLLRRDCTAPWLMDGKIARKAGALTFANELGMDANNCSLKVWLGAQGTGGEATVWHQVMEAY
jgi:hypothetical protein